MLRTYEYNLFEIKIVIYYKFTNDIVRRQHCTSTLCNIGKHSEHTVFAALNHQYSMAIPHCIIIIET